MLKGNHKNLSQRYEVKQLKAIEKVEDDVNEAVCKIYGVSDVSETPLDLDLYKIWDRHPSGREEAMRDAFRDIPYPEKEKIIQDAIIAMDEADKLNSITAARKEMDEK